MVFFLTMYIVVHTSVFAEPIIIKGKHLKPLIGVPVATVRVSCDNRTALPFQVDEVDSNGEYICDKGVSANSSSANGVLDTSDEIVFLREDIQLSDSTKVTPGTIICTLTVGSQRDKQRVFISNDRSISLSKKNYLTYDHSTQMLTTPWYYAQFAHDRFHFVRAGVFDEENQKWIHLTRQLGVTISLKALWGALPLRYTEDNLVCYVKRYRVGPIRCIRRGDFHLNIGIGLRGSKAVVYQCCYPQMVSVPVKVSIPVKFRMFFSTATIEMAPVIDTSGSSFTFAAPGCGFTMPLKRKLRSDTVLYCQPVNRMFTLDNGRCGYGWMLSTTMDTSTLQGSGFVLGTIESQNQSLTTCGYRLEIRDVERGKYTLLNRVLFQSVKGQGITELYNSLQNPATIRIGSTEKYQNRVN